MKYDLGGVEDVQSFVSVEPGVYPCRVAEARAGRSRDGSPRWSLRLEVLDGPFAGRTAAWDSITWSERGIYRVKAVLGALGVDVQGEVDLEPEDLVDLRAQVEVQNEEREDPLTGTRQVRSRVPYMGFAPLNGAHHRGTNGAPEPDGHDSRNLGRDDPDATPF